MNRLKNHSSLFETAPILVKEWHPSANFNLTPRSVNMGYSKKVWWLCNQGHKWQATIKARLKGNECYICVNEKKKVDLSVSPPGIGKNYRNNRRFKTKATAVVEVPDSGHWVYAGVTNISNQGLCFETEAAIKPGTMVKVKLDKSLVSSGVDKSIQPLLNHGYRTYNSRVKWCKQLDDDQSVSSFGIGVELI